MFHTSHVQYEQNRNQNMETRNIRLDSPSWNQSVYVESDWFYYNFQNILINLESYFWTSSQSFFDKAKASFLQNWTFNIDCDLIPFWTIWYVEVFLLGNREMHLYYCNLIATPFVAFVSVVISTQPRTSKKGEPMFCFLEALDKPISTKEIFNMYQIWSTWERRSRHMILAINWHHYFHKLKNDITGTKSNLKIRWWQPFCFIFTNNFFRG